MCGFLQSPKKEDFYHFLIVISNGVSSLSNKGGRAEGGKLYGDLFFFSVSKLVEMNQWVQMLLRRRTGQK